jgi:hypothetical protein
MNSSSTASPAATIHTRGTGAIRITDVPGKRVAPATGAAIPRPLERSHADRHSHYLDLERLPSGPIVAVGLDDAPMTHSGDGGHDEAMTFGGPDATWNDLP